MKSIRKRAKLRKITWHYLRHTRLTELAKTLTEPELQHFAGWTPSSKMTAVYVHLSGRDVVSSLLRKVYHFEEEEEENSTTKIKPRVCPVCGYTNPSTAKICLRCGAPLQIEEEEKIKTQKEEIMINQVMSAVIRDEEAQKLMRKALEIVLRKGLIHMPSS